MSRLCLTVTENTLEECRKVIKENHNEIDMVELRVDYLTEDDQEKIGEFKCEHPTILTFRKEIDGGKYSGDEKYRLKILLLGIKSGNYSFVDLEEELNSTELEVAASENSVRIIRSFHDFKGLPANLAKRVSGLKRSDNEIPKAAVMINSTEELLQFYKEMLAIENQEKIVLGMGNFGFNTRILAEKIGSYLTFCSKEGVVAAPGHASPQVLNNIYRFREITKEWNIAGVIGNPVMHTKSPGIHNSGYEKQGLDFVYVPFETDNPETFLKLAELLGLKGFSVTVPFKNDIIPLMDSVTDGVKEIGACNTATRVGDKWIGENTDSYGFIKPLVDNVGNLEGKKVTVIGAGGAAKAALFELKKNGSDVLIVNRTVEKAVALAEQFSCKALPLGAESEEEIKKFSDIIIQTTNVGMHPLEHIDPLSFYEYSGDEFLYDIIYTPVETLFLKAGKEKGCSTLNGWQMLLEQGYRQFKLFTGFDFPINS